MIMIRIGKSLTAEVEEDYHASNQMFGNLLYYSKLLGQMLARFGFLVLEASQATEASLQAAFRPGSVVELGRSIHVTQLRWFWVHKAFNKLAVELDDRLFRTFQWDHGGHVYYRDPASEGATFEPY